MNGKPRLTERIKAPPIESKEVRTVSFKECSTDLIERLRCCGTCKKWEIDTETSPYFMGTGREDCEHYDPTYKCENWEAIK